MQPAQLSLLPDQLPAPPRLVSAQLSEDHATQVLRLLAQLITRAAAEAAMNEASKITARGGRGPRQSTSASRPSPGSRGTQWEALITGHHDGFIDWDTYQRNQQRLAGNIRPQHHQTDAGAVREGYALCHGLATCGTSGTGQRPTPGSRTVRSTRSHHQSEDALTAAKAARQSPAEPWSRPHAALRRAPSQSLQARQPGAQTSPRRPAGA